MKGGLREFSLTIAPGLVASLAMTAAAQAGGFYSPFQSGPAIGAGLAGATARSDDASFFYYNPAAVAAALRPEIVLDARAYWPAAEINVTRATSPLGADISSGGGSGPLAGPVAGGASFAAIPLAEGLTLGFSGTSPFAGITRADQDWAGRFLLLNTEIISANVTTALAWQATPWLAIAAGPQLQFLKTSFVASAIVPVGAAAPPIEALGFVNGYDWAWGAVAGVVLTPASGTRIGLSYRSNITHEIDGHAGVYVPGIQRDTARFDFKLPEIVSAGIEQRISPELRLFAEAQWVNWSRFTGLDISFGTGRPNEVATFDWEDTWMGAVGFGWKLSGALEVTAGVSYDTAVSEGATLFLTPDSNRLMVGAGVSNNLGGGKKISLHYAHVFFEDLDLKISSPNKGTLEGSFEASLDMFGFTLHMQN